MMQPSSTMILIAIWYSTSFIISINHEETLKPLKPSSLPSADLNNLFILQGKIDREKSNYSMRIDSVVRCGSRFHSCSAIPDFAQKNSLNLDQDSRFLVQLHWGTQNSSCTLHVPMFLCNFRGRVVLKLLPWSFGGPPGSKKEPGLNRVKTRPWHTELCFRI